MTEHPHGGQRTTFPSWLSAAVFRFLWQGLSGCFCCFALQGRLRRHCTSLSEPLLPQPPTVMLLLHLPVCLLGTPMHRAISPPLYRSFEFEYKTMPFFMVLYMNFKNFYGFYYGSGRFTCVYAFVPHTFLVPTERPERALDPRELKLQMVVGYCGR